MSTRQFFSDTVEWLRNEQQLRTEVAPTHKVEDERGIGRIEGFFVFASSASSWAMRGLWALSLGAILAMTTLPGMTRPTQAAIQGTGWAGQASGATCLGIAEAIRRRHRKRALVELRAAEAGPVTPGDVARLGDDARGAEAMLVTETRLDFETLARAKERGVRCVFAEGGRYREATAQNDSGSSSPPVK